MLKALVGLSASIFTTIYVAAFRPDAISFLLFIAVGPAFLGLLAMPFLDASIGNVASSQEATGKGMCLCMSQTSTMPGMYPLDSGQ